MFYVGMTLKEIRQKRIRKIIEQMGGMAPEEINFNFTRSEVKEVAAELKIKGRSRMDKIVLCLNIEEAIRNASK